ncbi:hypothetical protein SDC9_03960 [bioreactor metagenome]|uniref:Uncharacterized protein n=1 Tax=bioreactor metagenome TaxID=1076179 RepID=A0A644SVY2_9ZZZZ
MAHKQNVRPIASLKANPCLGMRYRGKGSCLFLPGLAPLRFYRLRCQQDFQTVPPSLRTKLRSFCNCFGAEFCFADSILQQFAMNVVVSYNPVFN